MSTSSNSGNTRPLRVIDKDEEDLDELDDVLDQFTLSGSAKGKGKGPAPVKTLSPAPAVLSSLYLKEAHDIVQPPSQSNPTHDADDPELPDDFAAELAAGMESLMRGLAGGESSGPGPEDANSRSMREAWQKMLVDDLEGRGPSMDEPPSAGAPQKGSEPADEDPFQKTIRQAMEKLQNSDETIKADASSSTDPLAQLLAQMGDLGDIGAGGEGGEEGLQAMLESMMGQLMSKEILYEPLKELDSKFPEYISAHPELSSVDRDRYAAQHECARKLIVIFEAPGYSDDKPEFSKDVVALMNEMQSHGTPPAEIMGSLPPGFETGPDGMPKMPDIEGCFIA